MNEGTHLYKPAKARAKLPKEDLWDDDFIAEEKLNGARYLFYIGYNPYEPSRWTPFQNTFLSRRESSKDGLFVDKSVQLKHIADQKFKGLEDTVVDGEAIIPGCDLYTINGVMNSLPDESYRKQAELGMIQFHVFDILRYRGLDLMVTPLDIRLGYLNSFFLRLLPKQKQHIKEVDFVDGGFRMYFDEIVQRGGEGIIIKDLNAVYGKGWSKMKKAHDCSAIVMGFKSGEGKYEGMMGALLLGVYHQGELVEVTSVSGMTDGLRQEITDDPDAYVGRVVDIYAQELTPGASAETVGCLQSPTFYRFRDDVEPSTVTWAEMYESFQLTNTKSERDRSLDEVPNGD